jgi:DnaJ family protein A protein 2
VLSDPEKRELYDRYGEEGVEGGGGGGGGGGAEEMFNMLFGGGRRGGGGGGGGPSGPRKTQATVHPLKVSLEDMYNGKNAKIALTRSTYEADASGRFMDRSGKRYAEKQERVVLDVTVERGAKDGQKIVFADKGDQMPGQAPGDIVLVLQQKEHETFQRKGCDLIMKKEITLLEALTGACARARGRLVEEVSGAAAQLAHGAACSHSIADLCPPPPFPRRREAGD